MATATIYFQTKAIEWEVELEIEGSVETGGSNRYGSDEPEWCEVTVDSITLPNGKPLPRRMRESLTRDDWGRIEESLLDRW